ncbi:zinc-binding dehydrogenase [Nonomuraea solani]
MLIHAAAGGVGHLAVQLAKHLGAYVIGTARTPKHAFVRELGADDVIDYTEEDFAETVRDIDLAIDSIRGDYGVRSCGRCGTVAPLSNSHRILTRASFGRPASATSGRAPSSSSRTTPRWRRSPSSSRQGGCASRSTPSCRSSRRPRLTSSARPAVPPERSCSPSPDDLHRRAPRHQRPASIVNP